MDVRKGKFPAYKKILKNNFLNQYYHSTSAQNEDSKGMGKPKAIKIKDRAEARAIIANQSNNSVASATSRSIGK